MFRFQQFQDHSSFKRTRKRSSISNKSKISVKESDKIRRGSRIAEIFRSDKHILNDSKDKDNSNLDSKAIDQVYDMIDHAKVIRIYSWKKEQSQLLTNIGLPTTKRKIKFFKTKIQKFEKCAIYDEQNQLIKMASNPLAATQIFNSTYDELKSKRDFRNKVLENSRALKGLKSMKSKMKNDLELLYKHTFK